MLHVISPSWIPFQTERNSPADTDAAFTLWLATPVSSGANNSCYVFYISYSDGSGDLNKLECKLVVPPFAQSSACWSLRRYAEVVLSTFRVVCVVLYIRALFFPERAALRLDAASMQSQHSASGLHRTARVTAAKTSSAWLQHRCRTVVQNTNM